MLLLKFTTNLSPRTFLNKMRETQLFAFSTASSNATMPSTLHTLREKMGVDNSVASFTVPFGATINMDGTAIMQGVAAIFIANAYSFELGMSEYLLIIGMSVLASIGTAGVPGVGLIMLSMVFVKIGLPVDSIALLMSVDRLLDMIRTAVNVTGDAVVTCIIAKQEGKLDESIFYNFRAGIPDDELTKTDSKRILEEMIKSDRFELHIDKDGKKGTIVLKEE
jgi:Na+/H+-dicarboxylate symporter